jgi:hypothetical protein
VAVACALVALRSPRPTEQVSRGLTIAVLAAAALVLAVWAPTSYPGLISFATQNLLITLPAAAGLVLLLLNPRTRRSGWLILAATTVLAAVYFRVNPTMARYGAHLLPILIIPATYCLLTIWDHRRLRRIAIAPAAALALYQAITSYHGLHAAAPDLWFTQGYEQAAARRAAPGITKNTVIFAAVPEPYYLATHQPTQSFTTGAPYIFAPGLSPDTQVTVIVDQALKDIFPQVYDRLKDVPGATSFTAFIITEPWRYRTNVTEHPEPVILYQTTLSKLQASLK